MLAIAMFGVIAYRALSVSDVPQIDFPTIQVQAGLPGANPATMAASVATPLERQFTTIAGVDSMISSSTMGATSITLQFDLSRDIDGAAVDVETAIAAAAPLLPPGMPTPPIFRKQNPGDEHIITLAVTSPTMRLSDLDDYAETIIVPRISMIPGVAQVQIFGAAKYAVRVQVDPNRLAARRIGINEVEDAVQNWNVNIPTGTLYGPHTAFNVEANGQLQRALEYRPMIVAYRHGAPVRLDEVARVIDSVEDDKQSADLYGEQFGAKGRPAVLMGVARQPGGNTIQVIDAIRKLLPEIQRQLPPSAELIIRGDRSQNIREAFKDVQFTMAATIGLVVLVIFLFLRSFYATLIPATAMPFSILGTFSVMYLLGFTLNNISMMAVILSIGFVVDDAIVMLENITRHIEAGEKPVEAAYRGSREIGFTIVSMTLSLAAVFIPILFMSGILGRLFREFAITICASILISGMVSITLTPMLSSRLLHAPDAGGSRVAHNGGRTFEFLRGAYGGSLAWVLRHRPVMLTVFLAVAGATAYLYVAVPKGFLPDTDNDQFNINLLAQQGTSFYQMLQYTDRIAKIAVAEPEVTMLYSRAGGNAGAANTGNLTVNVRPRRQRKATVMDIINRIRPKISNLPGVRVSMSIPQPIRFSGYRSTANYDYTLSATDTAELYRSAPQLEQALLRLAPLVDVTSDLQIRNPQIHVTVDRDRAAALDVDWSDIANMLYSAFGPELISTIYGANNQYRVLLEVLPQYQRFEDSLKLLYLKNHSGQLVPLDAIAHLELDAGPNSVPHSGQLPSVTMSFGLRPGYSLGQATDAIEGAAKANLPPGVTGTFQGSAKVFQDSTRNMGLLLMIAVLVVYIVLGILYESYIHPLTILSGLPSAGFGALLTLLVFKIELSIYSFVGLILLIGIVKKNAIMQIDFALEAERKEGKSPLEAIHEGCLIRFRPIMMTTMAALLGGIPVALGWGSGGEARRPLGMAVVGGLVFSQLMTLYLTPVVYTYMAALLQRWRGLRGTHPVLQPSLRTVD